MIDEKKDELLQLLEYIEITYGKDYPISRKSIIEYRKSIQHATAESSAQKKPTKHMPAKLLERIQKNDETTTGADHSASASTTQTLGANSELNRFFDSIKDCQKCALGKSRNNLVYGSGSENADLMLIGEAPGAEEDLQGLPFVGKAGQLLTKILAAIDLSREQVYIANILKCRPPNNRDPLPDEVVKCKPYLNKQIEIIKPKVILLLGRVAAQTLLKTKDSLKQMRGKIHKYQNIDVMVTYHPAALLRNPNWKRPTWEDIKEVRALYNKLTIGNGNG